MNDENKDHDDFDDSFEDAFGIDEADLQEPLSPEEIEANESADREAAIDRPQKKSGSLIPLVIGVGILGFLGWKLYDMFMPKTEVPVESATLTSNVPGPSTPPMDMNTLISTAKTTPAPPPKTLPPPPPTSMDQAIPPPPPSAVAIPEPSPMPVPNELMKATEDELAKLKTAMQEQAASYKNQLDSLTRDVNSAKETAQASTQALFAIQQQLTQLNSTIGTLSDKISRFEEDKERAQIRQQQRASAPKKQSTEAEKLPSMTVYAIIPGRAWLRSANGKTITVAEGDTVGEYGKVLKIDASSGVVITTSGTTLR